MSGVKKKVQSQNTAHKIIGGCFTVKIPGRCFTVKSRNIFYSQVLRDIVTFLTLQDELILMLNREFYIL